MLEKFSIYTDGIKNQFIFLYPLSLVRLVLISDNLSNFQFEKRANGESKWLCYTKSVEYRLVMRRGKRQRGINNQFLITRFSIKTV
ncbi:MAG: hypothetical protein EWV92_04700 [Microcystis aeruginosa Ma_MB_S_20031200_S102]|uniref:Uncharacterized protein n=1 Tax=Microcystis aeruginosa Ma_MB_S_20031200_S102 TaxID=2486254 RepID=A0A552F2C4_MICAE|nr:MAG: hypothetical protein EWV92_04700 [Microcystis aeruginosa Ma_MB_S_20031200_S102]